jgi:hypothetical protein
VNVLAGDDGFAGKADDLVVAAHGFASCNRVGGDFVTGGNQAFDRNTFYSRTAEQLRARDQDVVGWVKADVIVHKRCHQCGG